MFLLHVSSRERERSAFARYATTIAMHLRKRDDSRRSLKKTRPREHETENYVRKKSRKIEVDVVSRLVYDKAVALLIVDVQPEYWSKCAEVRRDFPHFPEACAKVLRICRDGKKNRICFVRASYTSARSKWLPRFRTIHGDTKLVPSATCRDRNKNRWEDFAKPRRNEDVRFKSDWNAVTSNREYFENLRREGVDTVLLCGLITSVCVQHTAYGLFESGFRVVVVADACADRGKERHEAALSLYGGYMYDVVTTSVLSSETRV